MKQRFFFLLTLCCLARAISAAPSLCGENPATTNVFVQGIGANGLTVNVTAPATCTYAITTSNLAFVVTSPATATGNSTITFNVAENGSLSMPRVGVIIVGRKTITINQGRADFGAGAKRLPLDFNGDGVSDYTVIENQNGRMAWWFYRFHIIPGASTAVQTFGLFVEDRPVPADYDGDLKCDLAVWRSGPGPASQAYFYIQRSNGSDTEIIPWGIGGDDPTLSQDFDGDFIADPAVVRSVNGKAVWYIKLSATNTIWIQQFGNATDKPVRGDFDGDFRADLAVYRPNTDSPANTFFFLRSRNDTVGAQTFGLSDIDKIVPADFDGDGATDIAVWRTTTGDWFWMPAAGGSVTALHWGIPGDLPVPGEYNDTARDDYVVWRTGTQGRFFTQITNGSTFAPVVSWGNSAFKVPGYTMQVK